jgi:hypothetical protein
MMLRANRGNEANFGWELGDLRSSYVRGRETAAQQQGRETAKR